MEKEKRAYTLEAGHEMFKNMSKEEIITVLWITKGKDNQTMLETLLEYHSKITKIGANLYTIKQS